MQNYCKTIGALAAASALVAGTAKAELEYSINGGHHAEYLFRGVQQGEDMVTTGFDVATEAYGLSLSAGIWHADFNTAGGFGDTTETDIYFDVSKELGFWGLTGSIGHIHYIYDDSNAFFQDVQEVYFGLSKELCYGIDASLTYYWDIKNDTGGYTELGLSKSYDLSDCLSLGLSLAQGYGAEEGEFANTVLTATLDYAITETATLSPYVLYSVEGAESVHYENASTQEFVAGFNLTVSF